MSNKRFLTPAQILEELQNIPSDKSENESDGRESTDVESDIDFIPLESSHSSSDISSSESDSAVHDSDDSIPGKFLIFYALTYLFLIYFLLRSYIVILRSKSNSNWFLV